MIMKILGETDELVIANVSMFVVWSLGTIMELPLMRMIAMIGAVIALLYVIVKFVKGLKKQPSVHYVKLLFHQTIYTACFVAMYLFSLD